MTNASIKSAFERMWLHVVNALSGKSDTNHTHTPEDIGAVGRDVEGVVFTIDDTEVIAEAGAEIFNDYETNIATGQYSHAEGVGNIASGKYSHAEGWENIASGPYSHAEGSLTSAIGQASHAEGLGTNADGINSHAEGGACFASGECSHAEGSGANAVGVASHSEGKGTNAIGDNSHAEGFSTEAKSESSHAEGSGSIAQGIASHAEGSSSTSGDYSHAENSATARGAYSHAENSATSQGAYSHAENSATSQGAYSHAEGFGTISLAYQHAQGHYNNPNVAVAGVGSGTSTGTAFVIGNGTTAALSNAFRVDYNGKPYAKSTLTTTGADYAEYFEWEDLNPNAEDRRGYFVTLNCDKIKIAKPNDYILGIISGQPSVVGNGDEEWMGRYVFDEFGAFVYEDFEYEEDVFEEVFNEETGVVETTKTTSVKVGKKYKENPDYDPTMPYAQREDRPEWSAVGMLGVLSVRDDGTCQVNGYCTVSNGGIATASDYGYRVIKRVNDNIVKVVFR